MRTGERLRLSSSRRSRQRAGVLRWLLTLVRVLCGSFWLYMAVRGVPKLNPDWPESGILAWLEPAARGNPYPWYQVFLEQVVLPNHRAFAFLVAGGELAVGAALLVGLCTRLAALGGLLLIANLWLALNWMERGFWPWPAMYYLVGAALLLLLLTRAGRTLGLDALLARWWPGSEIW